MIGRPCAQVGTVRGEDYDFQFSGRVREGKLQFRLNLEYVGDDSQQDAELQEQEKHRYVPAANHFPSRSAYLRSMSVRKYEVIYSTM